VNCVSRTIVENLKQFSFKGDKSRVVRRTFWLIKVVPTWKKFEKCWFTEFASTSGESDVYICTVDTVVLLQCLGGCNRPTWGWLSDIAETCRPYSVFVIIYWRVVLDGYTHLNIESYVPDAIVCFPLVSILLCKAHWIMCCLCRTHSYIDTCNTEPINPVSFSVDLSYVQKFC
jgi:hypothetical protein